MMRAHRRNNYAVSELLGIVYILMISTTLISAIYIWAPPQLDAKKDNIRAESMLNQFETVGSVLTELINQGIGSSKIVNFVADEGYIHTSQYGSRFVIFHPLIGNFDFCVADLGFDDSDPDDLRFTHFQESLPSYFEQLNEEDKKIWFNISYLNAGTREIKNSSNIIYPPEEDPTPDDPLYVQFLFSQAQLQYIDDPSSVSYSWDFDYNEGVGGEPSVDSTEQSPMHGYAVSGVYTVALTVNDGNDVATAMQDVVVGDANQVHAAFKYFVLQNEQGEDYPAKATTGDMIFFFTQSTPPAGIDNSTWDFGVGRGPRLMPYHTFNDIGDYNVTLTVRNTSLGQWSNMSHTIHIGSSPPVTAFTYPSPVVIEATNVTVQFSDGSFDTDGDIASWAWDFGDGLPVETIECKYGPYTFDDDNGDWMCDPVNDTISSYNPDGDGRDADPDVGQPGGLFAFDDQASPEPYIFQDTDGNQWEYDDNDNYYDTTFYDTYPDLLDPDGNGENAVPEVGQPGGLYAFDVNDGDKAYTFQDIEVSGTFNSGDILLSDDPDGNGPASPVADGTDFGYLYAYDYEFNGDITHDFTEAGVYTVNLTVTDDEGEQHVREHDIVVLGSNDNPNDPRAAFSYYHSDCGIPTPGCGFWYISESAGEFDSIEWKVSETSEIDASMWGFSTYCNFIPYESGNLTVQLTVKNSSSMLSSTIEHTIYVPPKSISASFEFSVVNDIPISVVNGNLQDAVQIDVIIRKKIESDPYTTKDVTAGKIWLFDIGCIKYEASFSQNDREAVLENGAILSAYSHGGYILHEPKIYDESKLEGIGTELVKAEGIASDFIMDIMQFKLDGEKTVGPGGGNCKFTIRLDDSRVIENSIEYYDDLKMQIFGDRASIWTNFLKSQKGFDDLSFYDDTIYYVTEDGSSQTFMLVHSIFDIDLEVIG